MTERLVTANGNTIANPIDIISPSFFKEMLRADFNITGENPHERAEQLKELSLDEFAELIDEINKSIQGSCDSLVSAERVIKIGGKDTISLDERFDVFEKLVTDIKESSQDINPARVGDVLALGVVALHPFKDGNGRTARVLGMMFRNEYDDPSFDKDFETVIEPRDDARQRGGYMINGYVPFYPAGLDQSNAAMVSEYLTKLLHEECENSYTGCFGQAPLHTSK